MTSFVTHDDEEAARLIAPHLGGVPAQPFVGLLLKWNGQTNGAVIINGYARGNCEMSVAIWGPVGTGAVRFVFRYCFESLKCNRITIHTAVSNKRTLKMALAFGFVPEALCKAYIDGEDAIMLRLLAADQRIYK